MVGRWSLLGFWLIVRFIVGVWWFVSLLLYCDLHCVLIVLVLCAMSFGGLGCF